MIYRTTIGVIKGATRTLDSSSFDFLFLHLRIRDVSFAKLLAANAPRKGCVEGGGIYIWYHPKLGGPEYNCIYPKILYSLSQGPRMGTPKPYIPL